MVKMLSYCGQAWSLAIITLLVTRTVAISWDSVGSKIESSPRSIASSIEGDWSRLVGDLRGELDKFEQAVESELSDALVNSDGVLAQFTMAHQTYATRSMAPAMKASLTMNTEHHPSALN